MQTEKIIAISLVNSNSIQALIGLYTLYILPTWIRGRITVCSPNTVDSLRQDNWKWHTFMGHRLHVYNDWSSTLRQTVNALDAPITISHQIDHRCVCRNTEVSREL